MGLKEEFERFNRTDVNENEDTRCENAKRIGDYLKDDYNKKQLFSTINSVMDFVDFEKVATIHQNYLGYNIEMTHEDCVLFLKNTLKDQLIELFEKQCNSIVGIFNTNYEVFSPNESEPDDFDHCVNLHVSYDVESYDSLY